MYLFSETTDNIETFMIKPNLERVEQFKTNEMEKVPCEGRFLKALGNTNALDEEPFYLNWNNLLDSCVDSRVSKVFQYLYELIIRALNEHDYKSIIGQDISSQLQLFDISREPYRVFSKNMVQDLFEVGLLGLSNKEYNYSEFMDDVRQSGMVLEKSLKYSNKIL